MSLEKKLDFWIKNNYNVCFNGLHGCGKTSMIKAAFERAKLKWLYFSASTLDCWTDFVGIPKEMKDDNGNSYIELIRPKYMSDDIEAIFLDEYNRGSKKLKNSVMELIQFKSINGRKFPKLKVVWVAINPSDGDIKYDVEELDPAQKDRFHVIVDVPYLPSANYFRDIYGNDIAESAITWWKELTADVKKDVSPRRLDYALQMYKAGGDIRDVLPPKANINKLLIELETGSISKKLKHLFEENNAVESKKFLTIENNYSACIDYIIKKPLYAVFFLPLLSDEKVVSLISKHRSIEDYVIAHPDKFETLLKEIVKANTNYKLVKRIQQVMKPKPVDIRKAFLISQNNPLNSSVVQYSTTAPASNHTNVLANISAIYGHRGSYRQTTKTRVSMYNVFCCSIPTVMTIDEGTKTLDYLCAIITHSQSSTIKRMPNLIPMINHTVLFLSTCGIAPSFDKRTLKCLNDYPDFIYNVYNQRAAIALALGTQQAAPTPPADVALPTNTTFGPRNI